MFTQARACKLRVVEVRDFQGLGPIGSKASGLGFFGMG